MTDLPTATLGQMIDALTALAATVGRDTPVVHADDDTDWLMDIDPADFIAPNRGPEGEIIIRAVGYHYKVGEPRGDAIGGVL